MSTSTYTARLYAPGRGATDVEVDSPDGFVELLNRSDMHAVKGGYAVLTERISFGDHEPLQAWRSLYVAQFLGRSWRISHAPAWAQHGVDLELIEDLEKDQEDLLREREDTESEDREREADFFAACARVVFLTLQSHPEFQWYVDQGVDQWDHEHARYTGCEAIQAALIVAAVAWLIEGLSGRDQAVGALMAAPVESLVMRAKALGVFTEGATRRELAERIYDKENAK